MELSLPNAGRDGADLSPMITKKKSSPVKRVCPLSLIWAALCPEAWGWIWHRARPFLRSRVNKTLNVSLDVCFCVHFLMVKSQTSLEGPWDPLADWQHKYSHKAARTVYFIWAVECCLKKAVMALLTTPRNRTFCKCKWGWFRSFYERWVVSFQI